MNRSYSGPLHAQQVAAELQVAPLGRDIVAHQGQQLGIVLGMAYHTADLALPVQNEASPFLALLVRRPHRPQRDGLDEIRQARLDRAASAAGEVTAEKSVSLGGELRHRGRR